MLLEGRVGLPGLAERFEAVYVGEDGAERRSPWGWLPEVLEELGRPTPAFSPQRPR